MRKSLAAAAALLASTAIVAPAGAADRPLLVKAKPLAPAPASWTQFYIGGGIGLNLQTGNTAATSIPPGGVLNIDGIQGASLGLTATAGFDYQLSPLFVVGAFADYDWSGQSTTFSISDFNESFSATAARLGGGWTVGGRAGVLATPNILIYGLGGFTQMRLDNWSVTVSGIGPGSLQEPAHTLSGYTVGGGIEYRLTNNVSLRGEYRYARLGDATTVDNANALMLTSTNTAIHIARVEAAYRFGGSSTTAAAAPAAWTRMPAWTGLYGGLGLGGDAISWHMSTQTATVPSAQLADDGLGGGNVTGTATVGFDYQMQNWVAGVFGFLDLGSNGNARLTISESFGGSASSEVASVDKSWTAGGRLGYLIAPDALIYALAGYTTTSFHPIAYNLGSGFSGTASMTDMHGVTFGGGFEKLITDALSTRFEYRNTRLDTLTGFTSPGFTDSQAQATINSLRVLVAYRLSPMK